MDDHTTTTAGQNGSRQVAPIVASEQHSVLVQQAVTAIDAAATVGDVKKVLDQWTGLAAYARKAKDKQLEADAAEIKMRAARRLGAMMQAQKETVGLNKGGRPKTGLLENPVSEPTPTLAEAGIDKNLAASARKEAAKSEEQFASDVAEKKSAILDGKRGLKPPNPQLPIDLADAGAAAVRPDIEVTIRAIRDRHKRSASRELDRFLAAVTDIVDDLKHEARVEEDAETTAAERKALYEATEKDGGDDLAIPEFLRRVSAP